MSTYAPGNAAQLPLFNTDDHIAAVDTLNTLVDLVGITTALDQLMGRLILACPEIVAQVAGSYLAEVER